MAASIVSRVGRQVKEGRTQIERAQSAVERAAGELTPVVLALLLVAPVVCAALFYVWSHVATVRLGYEMSESSDEHRALLEENRALRIEVSSLKAPERLKQLAAEYQLSAPRPEQIVRLEAPAKKNEKAER